MGHKLLTLFALSVIGVSGLKAQCNADFGANPTPACVGTPVVFYDLSVGGFPPYGWTWNFGPGATPATFVGQIPPAVTYSTPGVKNVMLTYTSDNGVCTSIQRANIFVTSRPLPSFTSNAPQCPGQQVNFTYTGSAALTYTWDFGFGSNPNSSTVQNPQGITYSSSGVKTITLTINNGTCYGTASQTIVINALPVAEAGPDTTICPNASVQIGVAPVAGNTYMWFPVNTLSSGTVANPVASPVAPVTNYIVFATTTATGCRNSDTVKVTMLAPFVANAGADRTICRGDSTKLGVAILQGQTYSWSPSRWLRSTTSSSPISKPDSTIIYTLTVSGYGCQVVTDRVTVTVHQLPIVSAGPNDTITLGSAKPIIATGGVQYTWMPSTGLDNSGVFNPMGAPLVTTTYTVTVTDIYGCVNRASMMRTVISPSFWIASAFTPDGNGMNDVLYVHGQGVSNFEFGIYNRYGEQIFVSKDIRMGWDGKKQTSGEDLPSGAYVYYIKGTLSNNTPVNTKGIVNLIR